MALYFLENSCDDVANLLGVDAGLLWGAAGLEMSWHGSSPSLTLARGEASLAAGGHGLRKFGFPGRPTMLLGGVSRFVVRLDRFRCARQHGEVPPANDFRGGHRNIPRDRHLDHRGCLGIQRSLNTRAYVLRRFRFGGNFEAEGLRQCNEIHGIGSPVAGLVELRPDLPAHQVILTVANRNVAGVIEDEESNRNA